MKKILSTILIGIALLANTALAQTPHLGDSAYAALITCGAGDEIYETFGHSAIRICDPSQHIDVVYNYGMFSFTKGFVWKFCRGDLNYWVDRVTYPEFLFEYGMEGRAVWMQKLNITNQELNNLFVALEWNILPENKYYKYDFFMDNCATRARDMINNCLSHRTAYQEIRTDKDPSFRDEVYRCTEGSLLWWRLGIDIVLGVRCDRHASNTEQMFSPLNMMAQFDTLTFSDTHQPVVSEHTQLLQETRTLPAKSISPTLVFWIIFAVVLLLTLISWFKGLKLGWLDAVLYGLVGLMSLVVIFLWCCSSHYCTKANLNLLWCSPFFIYLAIRLRKSNHVVVLFQMAMLVILIIGFWWLPQEFNAAVMPIALTLLLRLADILGIKNIIKK